MHRYLRLFGTPAIHVFKSFIADYGTGQNRKWNSCIMVLFSMEFEVMDISGDVGIRAYGKSCEESFVNAGIGMYSLITDIERIDEKQTIDIETKGDSLEGLLVSYLNELIFQFDTYGFIGKRIEIITFSNQPMAFIKAKVYGEEFDPNRHERRLLVKAATYHNIMVEKINSRWEIEVVFDI
ncbi:MAG: archease [Thermodesulfovibrionales bacterium]|nr:archease [Thermodesulfovibrionales bacterium]